MFLHAVLSRPALDISFLEHSAKKGRKCELQLSYLTTMN